LGEFLQIFVAHEGQQMGWFHKNLLVCW
jgi:hypothetical protein